MRRSQSSIRQEVKIVAKKTARITLYKHIWCKIRYWQSLKDVTDAELASYLQVCERTIRDYDHSARCLTLEKVDNFLTTNKMTLDELLSM